MKITKHSADTNKISLIFLFPLFEVIFSSLATVLLKHMSKVLHTKRQIHPPFTRQLWLQEHLPVLLE